jgi:hypothetical protein
MCGTGGQVNDDASLLGNHGRQNGLAIQVQRSDIDSQIVRPLQWVHLRNPLYWLDHRRVIHEMIDSSETHQSLPYDFYGDAALTEITDKCLDDCTPAA